MLTIGHKPICPSCGEEFYSNGDWSTCEDCRNGNRTVECEHCGREVDEGDAYNINGCWYCDDCTMYCEYHRENEVYNDHNYTYIENYGDVCEDGIEEMEYNGEIASCADCGDYYLVEDMCEEVDDDGEYHYYCRHCHH